MKMIDNHCTYASQLLFVRTINNYRTIIAFLEKDDDDDDKDDIDDSNIDDDDGDDDDDIDDR